MDLVFGAVRPFMILESTEAGEYCEETKKVNIPLANEKKVFELDPLQDKRWKELVKRHRASSVFHRTEWLSALNSAYGYGAVVYTSCDPAAELRSGMVFCKVQSWLTGRRLVSLPFSDHCDPLVESQAELNELLFPVQKMVDRKKWGYCELRPVRFEPGPSTKFGQRDRYCWHAIDLRPDIETIFRSFHNSVQRKIRRAERESLTYEEGNSERLFGRFYKLLVETRRRQHLPPQPKKWFRCLMGSFGKDLKIRIASKDGIPVASILTLNHKNTVIYKYGCSDASMHPLGGVALVFWNTIQQIKTAGYETLDLGRGDIGNKGLSVFKEHWGGIGSDLTYWRYPNFPRSHESARKKKIVGRFAEAAPDRLLTAMGKLLYRHVG